MDKKARTYWLAVVVAAGLLNTHAAMGQTVTVCEGTSSCTIVSGGHSRQMSESELNWKNKSDARDTIGRVNCSVARDPQACRELISALYAQF